jgi:hypothetical protein
MPNAFAKKIIEEFVEKYVNQRGEIWNKIQESCIEYKSAKRIRQEKIDFLNKEREAERENYLLAIEAERDAEDDRLARELNLANIFGEI